MFKKRNLWFSLAVAAMMLLGGSMTTYASETVIETAEVVEVEEAVAASETEETSDVILVGEATAVVNASEEAADTTTEDVSEKTVSEETTEENAEATAHDHVHNGLQSLGVFRTTGYCPCYQCSEGWGRTTSTGAVAKSSHTIAVDPRVIPYGTKLMINGVIYTAEDRGGGVKGNHIDIFFDNHAQTRQHGSRHQEVFLVG